MTAGQIAYEAYNAVEDDRWPHEPSPVAWDELDERVYPGTRARWEAAAVAVRADIVANLRSRAAQEKRYGSGAAADALLDAANYYERNEGGT